MKNTLLNNKLSILTACSSLQEADDALYQIMNALDCNKFSYNYYRKQEQNKEAVLHSLYTEQSQDWQIRYTTQHYEEIDSIHNRMRKSRTPISWKLDNELKTCDKAQKQFFLEAMDFGLRGGFAVPVHSVHGEFANLVVQDIAILNQIARHPEIEYTLHVAAHYYHARVCHFLEKLPSMDINQLLTAREIECLSFTAQGKTAKEIARILNITPRTVSFHLENTIKKFGVSNKYQAVLKASHFINFD